MAKKQGKLVDPHGVVDSSDYVPQLAEPGAHDIIEVKEESWGSIFAGWGKGLLLFILVAITCLSLLYTGLTATLMSYVPLNPDNASRSWVVRGAWSKTGNQPPIGAAVAISENTVAPTQWWDNVKVGWVGISKPSVVKIQSTMYDTVTVNDKNISVTEKVSGKASTKNGTLVNSPAYPDATDIDGPIVLKKQYLVQCVSGSCKPGAFFIIDKNQIYGAVRK